LHGLVELVEVQNARSVSICALHNKNRREDDDSHVQSQKASTCCEGRIHQLEERYLKVASHFATVLGSEPNQLTPTEQIEHGPIAQLLDNVDARRGGLGSAG